MTLANMYEQDVRHLIAFCHNDACRHQAIIDVSSYQPDTPVPWFRAKAKCGKCGSKQVDMRPNWKEASGSVGDWQSHPAMPTGEE
jgi:hypothetical protein